MQFVKVSLVNVVVVANQLDADHSVVFKSKL